MRKVKLQLIDDWRQFSKFWSVRLGVIGTALTSALIASPDLALHAWNALPADLKALLPKNYIALIGVAFFVLSLVARIIKQSKPEEPQREHKQE